MDNSDLNYWRKNSKALLVLNSRLFGINSENTTQRELSYTISNLGNQEIYVKEINYFYGKSPLGPFHHDSSYRDYPANCVDVPVIIKPGEIKALMLKHKTSERFFSQDTEKEYDYRIVFLEVFSADGNRYDFVHDITELAPAHVDLDHSVWKAVGLKKIKMRIAKIA